MIRIIDGNNYFRIMIEADPTGLAPRNILRELQASPHPTIWVWDGAKGNDRRREKYPDYKMNRPPQRVDIYESFKLMGEVLDHSPAIQVKVPGYEGDDVIATLARLYAKAGTEIEIWSNDYDFLQLTAENSNIFCGAKPKDGVSPHDIRLYKTTVGDPSDNIKGIYRFGQKTWLETDKGSLKRFILEDGPVPDMPPAPKAWAEANRDQLKTYWDIVGFFDVPMNLINDNMTPGDRDAEAASAVLERYML